ncbi:MAG: hypothetical protein EXR21_10185 [Flavobacteriaceae bacterium]|nr:hypothetical protein [Flavobacteriaceae bacterium]
MGFFDFLKSPEEKKRDEMMRKMQAQIFPNGSAQIKNEVADISKLLNQGLIKKYSEDDIMSTYVHAAAIYFISDDKSPESITTSILHNKSSVVTKEDALKIFYYLQKRFNTNPLQTLVNNISRGISDGDKLFMVAKGGIVELKKAYKDITDLGKFEVVVFNSLIALRAYRINHPDIYEKTEEDFFKALFNQAKTYQVNYEPDRLVDFIESRFEFYSEELEGIFSNREGYLPSKLFSTFYITPLINVPESNSDLFEIMEFYGGLMAMIKWVSDGSKKI